MKRFLLTWLLVCLPAVSPGDAQTVSAAQSTDQPLRPIIATHTVPPYPPEAQAVGSQGTSLLAVHITPQGVADICKTLTTSGDALLDEVACGWIKQNWRWLPPTHNGKSIGISTTVQFVWGIKPPPQPIASIALQAIPSTHTVPPYPTISLRLGEQGTSELLVSIGTQGSVSDCKISKSSGSDRLDSAACDYVTRNWRWVPPTQAVRTIVDINWHIEQPPPDAQCDFLCMLLRGSAEALPSLLIKR